jgi:hypothetical protein
MGKGKGFDSMNYVWLIVVAMVTIIFFLTGFTNKTGDLPESELKYGPWWAWYIAVMLLLFIFVIAYNISMSYAESVLATKWKAIQDKDVDVEKLQKKGLKAM